MAYAEQAETEALHEPKSFLTKYIWSQDHKVIAIQYSLTALFVGRYRRGVVRLDAHTDWLPRQFGIHGRQ